MRQTKKKICNLRCTVFEPNILNKENLHLVILCHGYGAPGNDLVSVGEFLCQKDSYISENFCFIFPEGPLTLDNIGLYGSRAWWNIDLIAHQRAIDGIDPRDYSKNIPNGMPLASNMLMDLVNKIILDYSVSSNRIILGGFSQGSMITTDVALRMNEPPGGLIVMSGTLVCEEIWMELAKKRGVLNIIQSHGKSDPLLSFVAAERLRGLFLKAELEHKFLPFDGFHEIPESVLLYTSKFIKEFSLSLIHISSPRD